jgi:hypothetical protein
MYSLPPKGTFMKKSGRRLAVLFSVASAATVATLALAAPAHASLPDVSCGTITSADNSAASQLNSMLTGSLANAMTAYRASCARAIITAVRARGLPDRASVIAITTSIVEVTLRNDPNMTDHDSVGLFQQRASWGTTAQRLDPQWATNAFLNKMLSLYPDGSWQTTQIGTVCQAVQVSAFPDRYQLQAADAQRIVNVVGGVLHEVWGDTSGWHDGVAGSPAQSISAVNMGGQWPQVMAIENGVLHQIYGNTTGWHDGSAGLAVDTISAVNMGGQWPQVMALENNVVHQIYADTTGWHDGNTGIRVPAGTVISAVNMGGQWPQVMTAENGVLHQIYANTTGWHDASTGISADLVSAVNFGGQWPRIMTTTGGLLHEVYADTTGWHDGNTGIPANAISAVTMGGSHPQIMAIAGGVLHQIYADTTGWHDGNTGTPATTLSAVNMGGQWPTVMTTH